MEEKIIIHNGLRNWNYFVGWCGNQTISQALPRIIQLNDLIEIGYND
jgi:hypothetical protein